MCLIVFFKFTSSIKLLFAWFPTDTAAANQLDDYEEGTFTPTIYGDDTAGSTSGGTFTGIYTKIGNIVTATFSITDFTFSGGVGILRIGGFPVTAQGPNNREQMGSCRMYKFDIHAPSSGNTSPILSLSDNGTVAAFIQTKDAAAWEIVNVTNAGNLYIEGTITYST